jgi:hypothetical protein
MEPAIAIKFQFEDEIRRIGVPEKSSWEELLIIANDMFPQLEGFVLQYKDDEGSVITVRSNMEYQEAKRVARAKNSTLFFTVSVPKPKYGRYYTRSCPRTPGKFGHFKGVHCPVFNKAEEQQPEGEPEQVHRFITCDGCEQTPLRGIRYHCLQCNDFDLCGSCHQKATQGAQFLSHTADHPVVQISKPNCPRGRGTRWANLYSQPNNTSQCVQKAETTETTTTPTETKKEETATTEMPETNVHTPAPVPVPEELKEEEKVEVETEEEKKIKEALKVLREMGLINGTADEENLIELLKANNYDATSVIDIYFN